MHPRAGGICHLTSDAVPPTRIVKALLISETRAPTILSNIDCPSSRSAGRDCLIAGAVDIGFGFWANLKRVVDDRSPDSEIVVRQSYWLGGWSTVFCSIAMQARQQVTHNHYADVFSVDLVASPESRARHCSTASAIAAFRRSSLSCSIGILIVTV